MSSRALEAKHERILKELVRRPENKRCADCDTTVRARMAIHVLCTHSAACCGHRRAPQGPSYAVTNFNTFVCTVCGGVQCVVPPCC